MPTVDIRCDNNAIQMIMVNSNISVVRMENFRFLIAFKSREPNLSDAKVRTQQKLINNTFLTYFYLMM